jgi:hypothetical protein
MSNYKFYLRYVGIYCVLGGGWGGDGFGEEGFGGLGGIGEGRVFGKEDVGVE